MAAIDSALETRRKFVEGWNKAMVDIWIDQMDKLPVKRTGALKSSVINLPVMADGRFTNLSLSHTFLEYGLWVDFGVGREVPIGNSGDIGREKKRIRKQWFSKKYYASIMRMRDFMGRSIGDEFKSMFSDMFDYDRLRKYTKYYKSKGIS